MNICEATKEAVRIGGWMRRPWGDTGRMLYVQPTDTSDGCLIFTANEQGEHQKPPAKRWQPQARELMAEDWEVVTDGQDEIVVHLQGISMEELRNVLRRLRRQQGVKYYAHYRERENQGVRSHDYKRQ